jgi:hypothetical protein
MSAVYTYLAANIPAGEEVVRGDDSIVGSDRGRTDAVDCVAGAERELRPPAAL